MEVKRLRQVYIVAEDIDAQAEFYEQTLGLKLQFRDGDSWVQFGAGDVSFALASSAEGQGAPAGVPVPVFEVDDLDAALAAVREAGGGAAEIRDMGDHGRIALATDPAGSRLAFFQR